MLRLKCTPQIKLSAAELFLRCKPVFIHKDRSVSQAVARRVISHFLRAPSLRLLDVGTGEGSLLFRILRQLQVCGLRLPIHVDCVDPHPSLENSWKIPAGVSLHLYRTTTKSCSSRSSWRCSFARGVHTPSEFRAQRRVAMSDALERADEGEQSLAIGGG